MARKPKTPPAPSENEQMNYTQLALTDATQPQDERSQQDKELDLEIEKLHADLAALKNAEDLQNYKQNFRAVVTGLLSNPQTIVRMPIHRSELLALANEMAEQMNEYINARPARQ